MTVPEASVDEYGFRVPGKNDVRFAGEFVDVKAEAVAQAMQERAHALRAEVQQSAYNKRTGLCAWHDSGL